MTQRYRNSLIEQLKDPAEAAEYLNAALEEDDKAAFLKALKNVAQAQGFSATAGAAELNRASLYRMLSENGNPEFSSLDRLLHTLGLKISIVVDDQRVA